MKTDTPKTIYLKDYKPYPYKIRALDLKFDLRDGYTNVTATSQFERTDPAATEILLNGEALELLSLTLDGSEITGYTRDDSNLRLVAPAAQTFTLQIVTKITPETNTRLEGLYMSGGNYCTQCEAEGFRRITYFPDRPDVLTIYTVRIEADAAKFPLLLSNGNKTGEGMLENGRHFALWHDPFPKPCYLFALVAGDLVSIHDTYTTKSDRKVDLYIHVRRGDEGQCDHAMVSLKKSMKWDEDTYGLEYDLGVFHIVAVSDFNMGAMENKSLNIFNTALVLAHPDTATDADFARVESVIAHEYFHNWSGNRVTCRDWFQLSLKEGLTVFRDQEFSADMNSRAVARIDDVTQLRRLQFAEDASPLAHPVRPDNYIEINNFYTMTIYEKGAEVIRMIRTILGPENYRKGTDLYFSRHDGQAVTCDDFVQCMEEASGMDLSQFKLWYTQAGTPEVHFTGTYDAAAQTYGMTFTQTLPDTAGQTHKKPMHIPIAVGLVDSTGKDCDLGNGEKTKIIHIQKDKDFFEFKNIKSAPIPSILRNFSAPVKLKSELTEAQLAFLLNHDSDGFNRWEAGQNLYTRTLHTLCNALEKDDNLLISKYILDVVGHLIGQAPSPTADKELMARTLTIPSVSELAQSRPLANPPQIHAARQSLLKAIKSEHREALRAIYESNQGNTAPERALKNTALAILTSTHGTGCATLAKTQYDAATNMTDRVAALSSLTHNTAPERDEAFAHFYNTFKGFPLVLDKWFSLQVLSTTPNCIQNIKELKEHTDFNIKNPNRVRALYASFAMNNPAMFHAADGSGYDFLTEAVIELNTINPQIAARLLTPMRSWKTYTLDRQDKMKACLARILETQNLAPDIYEIAQKSLAA